MIDVFWIERTSIQQLWLRRFRRVSRPCASGRSYCDAMVLFGEEDASRRLTFCEFNMLPGDPRWPTKCDHCGDAFAPNDEYRTLTRQIYVRPGTEFRCTIADAPAGACWDAHWVSDRRRSGPTGCGYTVGDDHRSLVVKCPDGHEWMIDGRANNCTRKEDRFHHCWVRHGRPEDGTLHVDKDGNTCSAGSGSIDTGKYHGFLHHGKLT